MYSSFNENCKMTEKCIIKEKKDTLDMNFGDKESRGVKYLFENRCFIYQLY
jgi:hypothetical protein